MRLLSLFFFSAKFSTAVSALRGTASAELLCRSLSAVASGAYSSFAAVVTQVLPFSSTGAASSLVFVERLSKEGSGIQAL